MIDMASPAREESRAASRRHRQSGLFGGSTELMVQVMVIAILMVAAMPLLFRLQRLTLGAVAAWEMRVVRDATANYVSNNWSTVYASAASPIVITVATLKAAGYLSSAVSGTNPWQQAHAALLMQAGANMMAGAVVTYGGNAIPYEDIRTIASWTGDFGGYVPYSAEPYNCTAPCAKGVGSFWTISLSSWNSTGLVPTAGHLANNLFFNSGTLLSPFLYRYPQPNNPDAQTMHGGLNMNSNVITNAASLQVVDQVIAQPQAKLLNDLYGGTYNANNGTLTVQNDLLLGDLGNQSVTKGIYNASVYAPGSTVPSPSCPSGMSPQLFAIPIQYSEGANASPISSVEPISTPVAGGWVVSIRLKTQNGWVYPAAPYAYLVALTKCS